MGAILNGIKMTGEYQYYSYYQDYAAEDEEQKPARLTSGGQTERKSQTVGAS
jgi:succinoglycan biosynthesis transport protein ExoP